MTSRQKVGFGCLQASHAQDFLLVIPVDGLGQHMSQVDSLWEFPGFKYRHEFVRDVLWDIFNRAGVFVKKEAPMKFLIDPQEGRSTLKPTDVLVYGWIAEKHACVNLT
ncbi:auxilin-like protein [Trifolium medium]|uniref:Auxilin-like protein n=1 Tax=Trifolium medium TaxID=97028 RepID=A0A392M6I7_9FABA|nr:auxilin-like protein [Trifolium medium]